MAEIDGPVSVVPVDLNQTGTGVQKGLAVGTGVLAVLLQTGIIGASISNPIGLGIALASAFLPSIFGRKKVQKFAFPPVSPPQNSPIGRGLLAESVPVPVGAPINPPFDPLVTIGGTLIQIAAILTALSAYFDGPLVDLLPDKWRKWIILAAGVVSIVIQPLQRIGTLLSGK